MTEIKRLWSRELPAFPENDIDRICSAVSGEAAMAAGCFYLFRFLHRRPGPDEALMGDYCFGRFSAHLARLDSVPLNDAFADFLRRDTIAAQDLESYLGFLKALPKAVTA